MLWPVSPCRSHLCLRRRPVSWSSPLPSDRFPRPRNRFLPRCPRPHGSRGPPTRISALECLCANQAGFFCSLLLNLQNFARWLACCWCLTKPKQLNSVILVSEVIKYDSVEFGNSSGRWKASWPKRAGAFRPNRRREQSQAEWSSHLQYEI